MTMTTCFTFDAGHGPAQASFTGGSGGSGAASALAPSSAPASLPAVDSAFARVPQARESDARSATYPAYERAVGITIFDAYHGDNRVNTAASSHFDGRVLDA